MASSSQHGDNQETDMDDLLSLLVTSALVPIVGHLLALEFGESPYWSTDRMFVLYFSAVAGVVIADKIVRLLKSSGLWRRGYRLGDSDAFLNLICTMPTIIVLGFYDTMLGTVAIAAIYLVALLILQYDASDVGLQARRLYTSGFISLAVGAFYYAIIFKTGSNVSLVSLFLYAAAQLLVSTMCDLVRIALHNKVAGIRRHSTKEAEEGPGYK